MAISSIFGSGNAVLGKALPCYAGYGMGSIIRTAELEYPHLLREIIQLEVHLCRKEEELSRLPKKPSPIETSRVQTQSSSLSFEIENTKKQLNELGVKIAACKKERFEAASVEELLPIDYSVSLLQTLDLASESDNLHHIVLRAENAKHEMEEFASYLTRSHYSPEVVELVGKVSQAVLSLTKTKQYVSVLGAFITLKRVQTLDPIVTREGSKISANLIKAVDKYSVITQAVLGGVFIGYGSLTETSDEESDGTDFASEIASRVKIFSYVAQGAIPLNNEGSLWNTYTDWKRRLTEDRGSGFPVAYKVRPLRDICEENRIDLPDEESVALT